MKIEIRAGLFEFDDNHIDAIVIDGVPHVFARAIGDALGQHDGGEAFAVRIPFIRRPSFREGDGFRRIDDTLHEALGDAWQVIGMYSVGDVLLTLAGLRALDRIQPPLRLGGVIEAFAAACGVTLDEDEGE